MEADKISNTIKWIGSFAAIVWVLIFLSGVQFVELTAGAYTLIALLIIWLISAVLYATFAMLFYVMRFIIYNKQIFDFRMKIKPYANLYPIITSVVFAVFVIYLLTGMITITGAWTTWNTIYWIIHPIIILIGLVVHIIQNIEVI